MTTGKEQLVPGRSSVPLAGAPESRVDPYELKSKRLSRTRREGGVPGSPRRTAAWGAGGTQSIWVGQRSSGCAMVQIWPHFVMKYGAAACKEVTVSEGPRAPSPRQLALSGGPLVRQPEKLDSDKQRRQSLRVKCTGLLG